ncbi:SDR family oxidoreductase [Saccharophagus degradans]|uniref:SDR family oxidoreductase n=1 Tax=Saccharophagus degradans TaxID=86304 RepID=UPI001C09278B|nr:SDR family oxidoreductase [Saccharophagus degradans]MBU2985628.1 SDR family oxidoreductase [Saccharophagus degradans]
MIDLNDIDLDSFLAEKENTAHVRLKESDATADNKVAIIGMSGSIGSANSLDEFWEMITQSRTFRRVLPPARSKDFEDYLRLRGVFHRLSQEDYLRESFLDEIDKFDYQFFGLSKQEANLMDPNQRLFLQTSWAALENAGYGGESIKGSNTGVFVGYSGDFGQDYRHIIQTFAPDAPEISVAGNIKSIIASRIAYHLDLRGPSMLIDTACSSGLVSVHQACRSLRSGECDVAIAGAVKVDLLPIEDKNNTGVGTRDIQDTIAPDGKTRTFDDNGAGTSAAEGVIAFILKPLAKAKADGDYIHAVIAGSAVNQDGLSVGITAPNSAAQDTLITSALEDAGIAAEDVGLIEAHGTATPLGDPIEVSGITHAFKRFTQRKQYCAIGSVKTNIGHMDSAAGLAGLAKIVYAVKHAQLPPSLHFDCPNQNIGFENSPVYVNDTLKDWPTPQNSKRTAGVNSFGLSGTNCHLLVTSVDPTEKSQLQVNGSSLFLLSAKSPQQLTEYAASYWLLLERRAGADVSLHDICFTLATGRLHHPYRLAIIANSLEGLMHSLVNFICGVEDANVATTKLNSDHDKLAVNSLEQSKEAEQIALGKIAQQYFSGGPTTIKDELAQKHLQELFVAGARIDWKQLFPNNAEFQRVPLLTYPFKRERCWVEQSELARERSLRYQPSSQKHYEHPLLDSTLAASHLLSIYQVSLSASTHWELAEHRVKDQCVLPGTAYIEMLLEVIQQQHPSAMQVKQGWEVCIDKAQFISPLIVLNGETRDVHIHVEGSFPSYNARIVSQHNGDWVVHAEANLVLRAPAKRAHALELAKIKERLPNPIGFTASDDQKLGLTIGDRWNESFIQGWQSGDSQEYLVQLKLPNQYKNEHSSYHYHPAILDVAVNAANHLLEDNQLYLPFAYRSFQVYGPLPSQCFVHLTLKSKSHEMASFHIHLIDRQGIVVGMIDDYTVKRVSENALVAENKHLAYDVRMVESNPQFDLKENILEKVIFVLSKQEQNLPFVQGLLEQCKEPIVFLVEDGSNTTSILSFLSQHKNSTFSGLVYGASLHTTSAPTALVDSIYSLGTWLSTLTKEKVTINGPLIVLTQTAFDVGNERIEPMQAAMLDFVRVARLENPQFNIVAVDMGLEDYSSSNVEMVTSLWEETKAAKEFLCFRNKTAYTEELYSVGIDSVEPMQLTSGGVYLITGGAGALGLALARFLALNASRQKLASPISLVLTGTTEFPDPSLWAERAEQTTDIKLQNQLKALLSIIALGTNVTVLQCDVSAEENVKTLLTQVKEQFGHLNGIVHAAGRAGAGFIANKHKQAVTDVIMPKVAGALWLHKYTETDNLDFFVLYSSIATVLRNAGQTDYTAANRYLDALAIQRRSMGLPALSIRWPAWREIGIAVDFDAVDESEFFTPINTNEAIARLNDAMFAGDSLPANLVLANIHPHATQQDLVTANLSASDSVLGLLHRKSNSNSASNSSAPISKVTLKGVDEPSEVLQKVAELWHKVLGESDLAIDDQFSDLGGNSILSTQLYNEYEKLHPGAIDMADLFTYTTIEAQANQLAKVLGLTVPTRNIEVDSEDEDLDEILRRLSSGDLSAEEAESML